MTTMAGVRDQGLALSKVNIQRRGYLVEGERPLSGVLPEAYPRHPTADTVLRLYINYFDLQTTQ